MYLSKESQEELGRYFKEHRLKAGFNQLSVAEKLGYSTPQFVSNWERGLATPPLPTIKKLIQIYKIPKKNLLTLLMKELKKSIETTI